MSDVKVEVGILGEEGLKWERGQGGFGKEVGRGQLKSSIITPQRNLLLCVLKIRENEISCQVRGNTSL